MEFNITREVAVLTRMSIKLLRQKYAEVYDEETNCRNKPWLIKRIAWRLQAIAEGGLSEKARQKALELANEHDLRRNPRVVPAALQPATVHELPLTLDNRLPPPGTVLIRRYKGADLQVLVRADGFEYLGDVYKSLSAVAKRITGSHCNGFLFFQLNKEV